MKKKQGWWKGLTGSGGSSEKKKDDKKEGDGKDDGADEREKDEKVRVDHQRLAFYTGTRYNPAPKSRKSPLSCASEHCMLTKPHS